VVALGAIFIHFLPAVIAVLARLAPAFEWPPTGRGSHRSLRCARLERERIPPSRHPRAYRNPPLRVRPRVAARSFDEPGVVTRRIRCETKLLLCELTDVG
jgi:hypothetical protein